MLYFLTTRKHRYTMEICLRSDGKPLASFVRQLSYSSLFLRKRLPRGCYIFADIERLSDADLVRAEYVWDKLAEDGQSILQNHPRRVMKRFELLSTLKSKNLNTFNVYRLPGFEGSCRFPVFIRGENDHKGAISDLIDSQEELDAYLKKVDATWKGRRGKIITEFCDISDQDGVYRKYSAFCIGGRILPRHIFFRNKWLVKAWERLDPHLLEEEIRYVNENPHETQLQEIFELAGIDFGRIDYGMLDGKLQVWEINTNPMLLADYGGGGPARQPLHDRFAKIFNEAFIQLNKRKASVTGEVELPRSAVPWIAAPRIPLEIAYRKIFSAS